MTTAQASAVLQAALGYAERGWPVFPCHSVRDGRCTCGDPTCKSQGKHPRVEHGLKGATTAPAIIRSWWVKWPAANIAIVTGAESGLVILDVDLDHGGREALYNLQQKRGLLPDTPEAITGGGGRHILFQHPGQVVRNSTGKLGPGLDVRGDGGYIIASPSHHVSGNTYSWDAARSPDTMPLAPMPPWLVELLTDMPGGDGHRPAEPIGGIIVEGQRNATLTSLGGTMRRRGASAAAILAALEAENEARCQPPLEHGELAKIAQSVAAYARGPTFLNRNGDDEPAPEGASTYRRTDVGNAERFVRDHGDDALYCDPLGGWQLWNGRRWQRDTTGLTMEWAKATARGIYMEAAGAPTKQEAQELARWAASSEGEGRLTAMVSLSQSSRPAPPEQFDCNPWLLNVENGTVNLATGGLHKSKREDHITKVAPVVYDPEARDPVWDHFLSDVTAGDEELARYLQRAFGYSLTGDTREEVLLLLLGPTATGKSTLLESFAAMMGDYALKLPFDTFLQRRDFGAPRPDIAHLRGARFVVALEASKGRQLDEAAVKEIVGGDTVTAPFLYHDLFSFRPVCKLWFGTNFAPQMNNLDTAIWRRVRRVPFEREFGDAIDTTIKAHLRDAPAARSAILAWAIAGCLDWQRNGLRTPGIVGRKTAELRADMNPLREFAESCCVVGRDYSANARDLRRSYEEWAKTSGARPIGNKEWGEQLRGLGAHPDVRKGPDDKAQRLWIGIGLISDRSGS